MSDDIEATINSMGGNEPAVSDATEQPSVPASAERDRNPDGTFKNRESNESDDPALEAAADDGESEDTNDELEEEQPKPAANKRNVSERIGQLTAQRNEARARAEALEAQLRQYQPQQIDPDLEFNDPAQFTQQAVRQALNEQNAEQAYQQAQQARAMQFDGARQMFQARVEAMRDELPDFDRVFTSDLPISEVAVEFLGESEQGPRIAHHLGKNPGLAHRIAQMNPVQQAVELTRLEAKLSVPPPKRSTKAPAPAATISGTRSSGQFDARSASVSDIQALLYPKS